MLKLSTMRNWFPPHGEIAALQMHSRQFWSYISWIITEIPVVARASSPPAPLLLSNSAKKRLSFGCCQANYIERIATWRSQGALCLLSAKRASHSSSSYNKCSGRSVPLNPGSSQLGRTIVVGRAELLEW